jgi:S1-C subfamily serine protease
MARSPRDGALQKTVVKVEVAKRRPDYFQPWSLFSQETAVGSGCILPGRRILTNAHVVSDQVYLQVRRAGGTIKYDARVEFVDHDSETALLVVDEPEFFAGALHARFGGLAVREDKVAVYGFPVGGDELSITQGIVSRIEVRKYRHSQRELLAIQTDAAINSGSSGGPVFKDRRLVGIAFESYAGERVENTGYVVPVPVIKHFLEDVKDGVRDGVPELGIYWQTMESKSLRDFYRLGVEHTGVLVNRVLHGASASGVLEEDDVLTHVGGIAVANDGSVQLRGSERFNFSYLVSQHHIGEKLELGVLRRGEAARVKVSLTKSAPLVSRPRYDVRPTYFMFGGLVFMPLTHNYILRWGDKVDPRFRHYLNDGLPSEARREVVLINSVLAHELNVGYHGLRTSVVERINHAPIGCVRDAVEALRRPIGRCHVIEVDHHAQTPNYGNRLVLDAEQVSAANAEIMARYSLPADRSPDLAGL